MKNRRPAHTTTMILTAGDLEMLRDLAFFRAKLKGGRVSQGAVIRDLVRAAHGTTFGKGGRNA